MHQNHNQIGLFYHTRVIPSIKSNEVSNESLKSYIVSATSLSFSKQQDSLP